MAFVHLMPSLPRLFYVQLRRDPPPNPFDIALSRHSRAEFRRDKRIILPLHLRAARQVACSLSTVYPTMIRVWLVLETSADRLRALDATWR